MTAHNKDQDTRKKVGLITFLFEMTMTLVEKNNDQSTMYITRQHADMELSVSLRRGGLVCLRLHLSVCPPIFGGAYRIGISCGDQTIHC